MTRLRSLLLGWLLLPTLVLWALGFVVGYMRSLGRRMKPTIARCLARHWSSASA